MAVNQLNKDAPFQNWALLKYFVPPLGNQSIFPGYKQYNLATSSSRTESVALRTDTDSYKFLPSSPKK